VPRRLGLAIGGGLLLYAGHPPLDWSWAGLVALAPLLALARELSGEPRPVRSGAAWGFIAGLAFFGPLLYWIARFGIVPALLLSAVLAGFTAAFLAGAAAWGDRPLRALALSVWWVAVEAVRSAWPFGGFPWGLLGLTQHDGGLLLPVARSLGVLGVSLACAGIAAAVEEGVHRTRHVLRATPAGQRRWAGETVVERLRAPLVAVIGILVAAVLLGGGAPADTGRSIDMAGVQGNDQELPAVVDREALDRVERIVDRMVVATAMLADDPPDVAVWPENSLDADTRVYDGLRARVQEAIDMLDGAPIIAGALLDHPEPRRFYNTMVEYGPTADIEDVYVKRRLVPFGEYVPLRGLVDWYPTLRHVPNDGVPGDGPNTFEVAGASIGPITCYESVFPDLVRDQVNEGAQVLVVSVNNASYGRTAATEQHLAFSRVRAVETGRWILHAGISGISAVVDPNGVSSQETPLFEQAIVRADLPLVDGKTPYMRFGDVAGPVSTALAGAGLLWLAFDRRRAAGRRDGQAL
jgi:apolipoprotein N-acyltransferase